MSFVIVGSLTMTACLFCVVGSETVGIAALLLSALFASASAVAIPGLGGIQPTHLILGALALKALLDDDRRRRIVASATSQAGLWLLATWIIGATVTLFMPRLFEGLIAVNPVRADDMIEGAGELALAPTPGNITQFVYLSGDVVTFLLIASYLANGRALRTFADIYLAYCVGNLVFGALDYATAKTGTTGALEFMRNANYTIYNELDASDIQRVKGSFTEASAFAFATIGCFCFSARLALAGRHPRLAGIVAILSIVFIAMSTSSTGYIAALFCVSALFGGSILRIATRSGTGYDLALATFGPLLLVGVVLFVLTMPSLSESLQAVLDSVIFDKSSSQSGIDRSALNATAMQALLDTYGLGVGIGSTRCSSFVAAALSNLGLAGSFAFAGLIVTALRSRPERRDAARAGVEAAVRFALVGSLVAASLSGAMVDLGVVFFALLAVAAGPCIFVGAPSGLVYGRRRPIPTLRERVT